jgi:large subunit ribosomal protein L17
MRHRKHRHTLGVTKEHRSALLANLASSLIKEGRIRTTLAKAKALRPFVEPLITLSKSGTLHQRRLAMARLRDEDAVRVLFNEKAQEFANRPGGYTRIYKLGNRLGDAAEMALIELVGASDQGYRKSRPRGKGKAAEAAAPEAKAEATAPEAEPKA